MTRKNYNNRTQMFRDFGVINNDILDNKTATELIYNNHRNTFEFGTLETVATSQGTYGVNGAVIKATKKGYNIPVYFGINKRSTLLLELI